MTSLEAERQNKNIKRAVYGLLVTLIVMFVLVIILLQIQNNESLRREKEANDYHLAISNKALTLLASIDKSRLWFRVHRDNQSENPIDSENRSGITLITGEFSARDQVQALGIEIEKLTAEIGVIHQKFKGEHYNNLHQILDRAKVKFENDIRSLLSDESYSPDRIDNIVAPMISITHQLQRLHQQNYQEIYLSRVDFQSNNKKQIIWIISGLVIIGIFGIFRMLRLVGRTLSELAVAQHELQEKEARLREAEHVARMGYIEWNPITNELNWSDETYNILGLPTDFEPTLESMTSMIHPEDTENVTQAIKATVENNEGYNIEYRVTRPDDSEVFIHAIGETTINETGKISRLLSTIRDITEAKLAEAALLKYQNQLEELVAERTKELEDLHEEFIRKERLATLGQLTGTVSHELRNPLGAIKSALYIINKLGDKEDERIQKAIVRADHNIDRCTLIIEELLDFTRVTKLIKHDTMIDEWLESIIDEQEIQPGIRLETNFSLKDVELGIDPERLRRAVLNIFENACQSMLDNNQLGEPLPNSQLSIKSSNNNNRIEISVTDNGSGMPGNVKEKIFEPLFSTKSFGVGLGMPTVKQIMEQHDGDIEIDTEEGAGTKVTLWLPCTQKREQV